MVDQHIQRLLTEGSDLMHFATDELDRAEEDVVAFFACTSIKRSINLYLQAFIESYRITPPPNHPPDELLKMCISIDPKFARLDFSPLECSHIEGADNYCFAMEHVTRVSGFGYCYLADGSRKNKCIISFTLRGYQMEIPDKYRKITVEALGDLMYRVSLDLSKLKGQPLTRERKQLTKKQRDMEDLLHLLSVEET